MKILVTGGAGFIGSHLCDALLQQGHRITVIDDLSTGHKKNLAPQIHFIEEDISKLGCFDSVIQDVDAVYHLAAVASVERGNTEWYRTHQINIGGTVQLFDAIHQSGRNIPVVYASSAAVYGDDPRMPLSEKNKSQPVSAYGVDKYACELHGYIAAHIHNMPNIGLRFFNVYGERQDPTSPYSGVISIFCDRILSDQSITINGDGQHVRDFIYVDDIVNGLQLSMHALISKKIHYGIFNLATGIQTSVNDVVQAIAKATNKSPDIHFGPERPGDPLVSQGDTIHAKNILGFEAKTALNEGITKMLKSQLA